MISAISLMFICYVYVHMCVCLHAETASSRGLLQVTVRYSHLCVSNLLFHRNEKKKTLSWTADGIKKTTNN